MLFFSTLCGAGWLLWHDTRPVFAPLPTPVLAVAVAPALAHSSAPVAVALADLPLFGAPQINVSPLAPDARATNPTAGAGSAAQLPLAEASYRLYGVIASSGVAPRCAILGSSDVDQAEYAEGASAPDGAIIRTIGLRTIVIDRAGALARLELVEPTSAAREGGAPTSSAAPLPSAAVRSTDQSARLKSMQAARRAAAGGGAAER